MRVVFVGRYPPRRCGVAEYTYYLASALREYHGVDVSVAASVDTDEDGESGFIDGVCVRRCFSSYDFDSYGAVVECVEEFGGADVVHIQHEYGIFPMHEAFIRLIKSLRERVGGVVVTLHTVKRPVAAVNALDNCGSLLKEALLDASTVSYQRRLVEAADAVVVHSIVQETELWAQGADLSKVWRIPHGTVQNPYTEVCHKELLQKLGVDADSPILSVPGFMRLDKGLDTLLKAMAKVTNVVDATLVIAGTNQRSYGEMFSKLVSKLPKGSVKVLNKFLTRDEMLMLAAASDVIVLPYREKVENVSVSGILHLAMGSYRPIVASRVPRLVEYYTLAPEMCVAPNNVEELANKLVDVLEGRVDVKSVVRRVRKYARETSWSRISGIHVKMYSELVELKRASNLSIF